MNIRRVLYIAVIVMVVLFLYNYSTNENDNDIPVQKISREAIMHDFEELADNQVPEASLGGVFFTTQIFFASDFAGQIGDDFYVSMEDGHSVVTQKYKIKADEEKQNNELIYILKDNFEEYVPPADKFETYNYDGTDWVKVVIED